MDKINWKQKLSSRKFWSAIIGVVIALATLFKIDDLTTQQIIGVISALSVLAIYIIGESAVDISKKI